MLLVHTLPTFVNIVFRNELFLDPRAVLVILLRELHEEFPRGRLPPRPTVGNDSVNREQRVLKHHISLCVREQVLEVRAARERELEGADQASVHGGREVCSGPNIEHAGLIFKLVRIVRQRVVKEIDRNLQGSSGRGLVTVVNTHWARAVVRKRGVRQRVVVRRQADLETVSNAELCEVEGRHSVPELPA
jgi:hypothetical protein